MKWLTGILLVVMSVLVLCLAEKQICTIDLVLVADNSGSVTTANNELQNLKSFLKNIVAKFNVGTANTATQIGLVKFASTASIAAELGQSKVQIDAAIDNIGETQEYTNTLKAVEKAADILDKPGADRDDSQHLDVIVIVTDGRPTVLKDGSTIEDNDETPATKQKRFQVQRDISLEVNKLRVTHGAKIITVGVGPAVDSTFLKDLADSSKSYFMADNFDGLSALLDVVAEDTCKEPEKDCDIDLAIAADLSGSVGNSLKDIKSFLHHIVSDLYMKQKRMHIALLDFSEHTNIDVQLDNYDTDYLYSAISNLITGGWTGTAEMLHKVDTDVFNGNGGDRSGNPNVLLVLTDGLPTVSLKGIKVNDNQPESEREPLKQEVRDLAKILKEKNVVIVPVIVKGKFTVNYDLLKEIAYDRNIVVEIDKFEDLMNEIKTIKNKVCVATDKRALDELIARGSEAASSIETDEDDTLLLKLLERLRELRQ